MASFRRIRGYLASAAALVIISGGATSTTYVEPQTGLRFALIPAGAFDMGSPEGEPEHRPDERLHHVVFRRPFYLSVTEVTQGQWRAVMGNDPSHFRNVGDAAPVEQVTWFEAQEFLRRLSARGNGRFRLPTEAEWEYACRAGTRTPFHYGTRASTKLANYDGRAPVPVASFRPNAWGLYDMHGNVWEWCADNYCPYPSGVVSDPWQMCRSPFKVIRGGSWYFGADSTRSALRYTHEPQLRGFSIGFRVVREVPVPRR